jgi:hypothetical protein
MDDRGWQRPLGRGGGGRGARAKPAVGDGNHDQGHAEPKHLASVPDGARDAGAVQLSLLAD